MATTTPSTSGSLFRFVYIRGDYFVGCHVQFLSEGILSNASCLPKLPASVHLSGNIFTHDLNILPLPNPNPFHEWKMATSNTLLTLF